jgi:hypothetical protein
MQKTRELNAKAKKKQYQLSQFAAQSVASLMTAGLSG